MKTKTIKIPKFKNQSQEADWWASAEGRAFVRQHTSAALPLSKGSRLVAALNKKSTVQIALRLPETDLQQARQLAERKGVGYQTLLKMLVREGLQREARRR